MEPTLMVIGLNHRTAPVAVRERFWINESARYDALSRLVKAEGIDEVVLLSTCNRTEFLFWASDITLAANSLIRFLTAEYGLKLCEWKHFARLLDEAALVHIFRVASSLDSMMIGEPQIVSQVKEAWAQAQKVGATGRFLDAVLQKALTVSKRVRNETAIGNASVSIPYAAIELVRQIFETLEGKKVLLLGAGKMSEISARGLISSGVGSVHVINRTFEHAADLAAKLACQAAPFEDRGKYMAEADIIISSTSCPHIILGREEAERIAQGRDENHPLVIVDIAMPRDIDPAVRDIDNIFLYDLDDLESVVTRNTQERKAAAVDAERILLEEARGFRHKRNAERVVPTIVALRQRLDEICRQELDSFRQENGPFSTDLDQILNAIISRATQRIAGSLARELKELPERAEQEQMTLAVQRLFHLPAPQSALAGAISQKEH